MRALKTPAKVLALLAPLAAVLYLGHMELRVSGEFRILPAQNNDVRAEVEAIVEEIYVEEGTTVNKGDPIARLSDRDYRAELGKLRAEIDEKQANLRMLRAGPRTEEIDLLRATVEKAEQRIRYARAQLERLEALFAQKVLSRKELDESREEVSVREKELEEAKGRLNVLLAGSRPEEIEAVEAALARLKAQERYQKEQLRFVSVLSPIKGVITTPNLKEMVGQQVKRGDLIAKVHELDTVTAEISVSEKEISDVKVGEEVVLRARAFPGTSFHGTVVSIAPTVTQPKEGQVARTILVTTHLDNRSLLLKPEMTGNAKILCGRRRMLDLVTRRFARYIRVEFWSWW